MNTEESRYIKQKLETNETSKAQKRRKDNRRKICFIWSKV